MTRSNSVPDAGCPQESVRRTQSNSGSSDVSGHASYTHNAQHPDHDEYRDSPRPTRDYLIYGWVQHLTANPDTSIKDVPEAVAFYAEHKTTHKRDADMMVETAQAGTAAVMATGGYRLAATEGLRGVTKAKATELLEEVYAAIEADDETLEEGWAG